MARGDSLARQHRLIRMLSSRREVRVQQAAQELGASERTLYRDLRVLERVGVPIYAEREGDRTRWRVVDGYEHRLAVTLSWTEMVALAAGRGLLDSLRATFFDEAAGTALEKIREGLPAPLALRARALLRHVSATGGTGRDHSSIGDGLQQLFVAIEQCQAVRFGYRKPSRSKYEQRRVDPYHLHVRANGLYLLAHCRDRRAMRIFALERMRDVALTGEHFTRLDDFAAGDFVHGPAGMWSGKAQRVRLRFAAAAAGSLREQRFHDSQASQLRRDGALDMTLRLPLSPALVAWVTSFGPRVKVLSPKELARRVDAEHRGAIAGADELAKPRAGAAVQKKKGRALKKVAAR